MVPMHFLASMYIEGLCLLLSCAHGLRFESQILSRAHFRDALQVHAWKQPMPILDVSNVQQGVLASSTVYFLRHGETLVNKDGPVAQEVYGTPDLRLDPVGVRQATAAQKLLHSFGLFDESPEHLQIAASTLSRAFDTTVIATAPIWGSWTKKGNGTNDFRLHGLPAAMEFDMMNYSRRAFGVQDDDPVRWIDSVLGQDKEGVVVRTTRGCCGKGEGQQVLWQEPPGAVADVEDLFYQTEDDDATVTLKPVEVRTNYSRHRSASCDLQQLEELKQYIVQSSLMGKKHILIGTHGGVVQCFGTLMMPGNYVPVANSVPASYFSLEDDYLPNGGILQVHLNVTVGDAVNATFKALQMYENPQGYSSASRGRPS